jgi:hypothetical protein
MNSAKSKLNLARFQSLLALAVMVVALSLLSDRFLTADNSLNILRQIAVNLCLSIGMTLVIVSGGIDLSVGAILGLTGAIAAKLLNGGVALPVFGVMLEVTVTGAIVAGVLFGLVLGWFNGVVITRFALPPFVATLGMLSIARGLTMLWTGGFPITGLGPTFGILAPAVCWVCRCRFGWSERWWPYSHSSSGIRCSAGTFMRWAATNSPRDSPDSMSVASGCGCTRSPGHCPESRDFWSPPGWIPRSRTRALVTNSTRSRRS